MQFFSKIEKEISINSSQNQLTQRGTNRLTSFFGLSIDIMGATSGSFETS